MVMNNAGITQAHFLLSSGQAMVSSILLLVLKWLEDTPSNEQNTSDQRQETADK